jgi:hypothetical protein
MVITRTDDGGNIVKVLSEGGPQSHACQLAYRHGPDVAADGETLALASTTGGLWVSGNAGEEWHNVSHDLPPMAVMKFAMGV